MNDHNTIIGNKFTPTTTRRWTGICLATINDGVVDTTIIKSNSFWGYPGDPITILGNVTNTTLTGTKVYACPAPGS
jgi:hypothetical protein